MMKCAPIVIFAFNRPDLLNITLSGLSSCEKAKDSCVYVYIDGPRNKLDVDKIIASKKIADSFMNNFLSLVVIMREKNHGLAESLLSGITDILSRHESIIVLEDDLIVSPGFIDYMNIQLSIYKDDVAIGSVSGFSAKMKDKDSFFNYFHPRPCSWGWATWRDRWEKGIWHIEKLRLIDSIKTRLQFNQGGQDLYRMLISQEKGEINSWAIRWAYTHFKHQWVVSYPIQSFVENIGFREDGTHCRGRNPFPCEMYKEKSVAELKFNMESNLNKLMVKQANYYHSNIYKLMFKLGLI